VVARLGELEAERAAPAQRRESEALMATGEHRAAAALLTKLLRQAPGDAELGHLLAEAERRRGDADAAADARARAAEAELLAMEAGEQAAQSSKAGKKKEKKRRQQERARAAKAVAEAAASASQPEPAAAPGWLQQHALDPQPVAGPAAAVGARKKKRYRKKKGKGAGDAVDLAATGVVEPGEPELAVAEPDEPEQAFPEPEPELELSAAAQQLIALTAVPMVGWPEKQVLVWTELVELEPETRAALRTAFEDDGDTDGEELVAMTAKRLQKMLKKAGLQGDPPAAAGAVLALRDALLASAATSSPRRRELAQESAHRRQQAAADVAAIAADKTAAVAAATHPAIAAAAAKTEEAAAKAEEAAAKAAPSCQICFEPYGGAVVPRMLVTCGHTFCDGCLSMMLRCAPPTSCVHRPAPARLH
jgi:hypothetical protein